jgi:hypothetical protein
MNTEINNKSYGKHKGAFIILIIATIVFALAITPGVYVAMMSVMLFDAPGSTENTTIVYFFYAIVSFPVMCVVSNVSWIFYAFKLFRTAIFISLSRFLALLQWRYYSLQDSKSYSALTYCPLICGYLFYLLLFINVFSFKWFGTVI